MAHTCSADGCNNPIWGGSKCKFHQYQRRMQGGDLFKRKPKIKVPTIPKESKKRKQEHIHYSEGCKQLEKAIRDANDGKIQDFFTNREIIGFVTWHHLLGRTGNYYLDKDLLVPCENDENDGHLFWHRATVEQLQAIGWYEGFLKRLKNKSLEAYNKEIRRFEKVHKLNPSKQQRTIWDELTD
jgi:hypothetical protein